MKITKIYFDMDGVLVDFDKGVKEILGLEPVKQEYHTKEFDDELFGRMKEEVNFYRNLDAIDDSVDFFNDLYDRYGPEVVEVLTGIPNPKRGIDAAGDDKVAWVKKYLPEDVIVHLVQRKDKKNYCKGKDYILIDDFSANTKEWEKAGGTAILFTDADSTRKQFHALEQAED